MLLKKKKKLEKSGGNYPKCRCLLVPPVELMVFGRVPQESSRDLWGAESFQQSASGSSWGFALPFGAGVATASPSLAPAMPNPSCGSDQGHIQHLPAGFVGYGQLVWVCLAFLLVVGTGPWGRCRGTTRHSPAASVVLDWFKGVPASTDIPGAVGLAGIYPSSQAPFGQELWSL